MKRRQFVTSCQDVKPLHVVTVWAAVLLALLLSLPLASCCPCRHIATSTADSIRIQTLTRTEYIRDTVYVSVPEQSTSQTVTSDFSHLETNFAVSDARIESDGSLFHSLWNKPQNVPVATETPVIYRDSIVYRDRVENSIIEVERPLTAWQRFQMSGFWALASVSLFIILRHLKKYISL